MRRLRNTRDPPSVEIRGMLQSGGVAGSWARKFGNAAAAAEPKLWFANRGRSRAAVRPKNGRGTWHCSKTRLRSSLAAGSASAAHTRCCSRNTARGSVVNDTGGALNCMIGQCGADRGGCKNPRKAGAVKRWCRHALGGELRRRRCDREDGGRQVRRRRHSGEQRGHPARLQLLLKMAPEEWARSTCTSPVRSRVCRRARGQTGRARSRRPHHQHQFVVGTARQLRPGELRRGESRHPHADADRVDRTRE